MEKRCALDNGLSEIHVYWMFIKQTHPWKIFSFFELQGEWEDDERNGYGVLNFACGDNYEGQWIDNKEGMFQGSHIGYR